MARQGRGMLTDRIKKKSKELMGEEMTQKDLRLMVYVHDVMTNSQRIDPNKIESDERKILRKWKDKNYMEGGASGLQITKEFWDIMCELVFLGYVDLYEDDVAEPVTEGAVDD